MSDKEEKEDKKEKEEETEKTIPDHLATEGWEVGSGFAHAEDRRQKKRQEKKKGKTPDRGITFSIDVDPSDKG